MKSCEAPAVEPHAATQPQPFTEGVKYAGSKLRLIPQILALAGEVRPARVFDGFSGTTRVSQAFARNGMQVVSNDSAVWSGVFGRCYLLAQENDRYYNEIIEHLNALAPRHGWFSEHYGACAERTSAKMPFQLHNAMKLDAVREEIDRLELKENDRAVCLTSLILALDRVDSTLGHFASYLRKWSPRSYNTLELKLPAIVRSATRHEVLGGEIFTVLPHVQADLAYFDPPYGSNNDKMPPSRVRYSAYYHLWTTVCLNDRPELFGRANRRQDSSDTVRGSVFEEFRKDAEGRFIAVEAIGRLLTEAQCRHIILSYSSGGRATSAELNEVIRKSGRLLKVLEIDYKRNVMAAMSWTKEWLRDAEETNREFLFLIEKR